MHTTNPLYVQEWTLRALYADADGNTFPAVWKFSQPSTPSPRNRHKGGRLRDWRLERETLAQIVQWEGDRLVKRTRFFAFAIFRDWAASTSEAAFHQHDQEEV